MTGETGAWMVRAGERGWRVEEFEKQSIASIGWAELGDLTPLRTRDDFLKAAARAYPDLNRFKLASVAGQVFRFVREIQVGDFIVTYHPAERHYLLGKVSGEYAYCPDASVDQPNQRAVSWQGHVLRDQVSVGARNTLGAISTLFALPAEVASEIKSLFAGGLAIVPAVASTTTQQSPAAEQVGDIYKDIQNRAFEFIKDRIDKLEWDEMQELVAGLLRAMGYKTRISPSGSDRGKDIVASPDGLGLEDPRIVVEVKHRGAAMSSQEIRGFLGGRHDEDSRELLRDSASCRHWLSHILLPHARGYDEALPERFSAG